MQKIKLFSIIVRSSALCILLCLFFPSLYSYTNNNELHNFDYDVYDDEDESDYLAMLPKPEQFLIDKDAFIHDLLEFKRTGGTFASLTLPQTLDYKKLCASVEDLLRTRHEELNNKRRGLTYAMGTSSLTMVSVVLSLYFFSKKAHVLKQIGALLSAVIGAALTYWSLSEARELADPLTRYTNYLELNHLTKDIIDLNEIKELLEQQAAFEQDTE